MGSIPCATLAPICTLMWEEATLSPAPVCKSGPEIRPVRKSGTSCRTARVLRYSRPAHKTPHKRQHWMSLPATQRREPACRSGYKTAHLPKPGHSPPDNNGVVQRVSSRELIVQLSAVWYRRTLARVRRTALSGVVKAYPRESSSYSSQRCGTGSPAKVCLRLRATGLRVTARHLHGRN